ncbi:glycosyltransferase [Enterobacter cloacae]|uniref:glycosyltransferase n=1 Tax=Enterobacter cloacae TaxID=550 RepID=UPI00259D7EF6|nr:glycosyltransferase [Enterobacter cloacae]EKV5786372.1 glycosyltransferase [Enterobacter cloacae]
MKKVIALIVTYKRKEFLSKVIKGLHNQSYPINEIVIVDNNSQDGTDLLVQEMQKEYANAALTYFNTGANLGGAGGFAFGFDVIKNKEYDYIWLMDDDLLPSSDCLSHLVKFDNNGITQPMRFNLDGSCAEISPVKYDLSDPFIINPKRSTIQDLYEKQPFHDPVEIDGVPFEGPLISKELVDKIEKPDARFFIFNDDLDYSIRARNHGYKIVCHPEAKATRLLVNNQANDLNSWKGYFMLRNHFYILRVHGNSILVKMRPLFLTVGYFGLSLLRGKISLALTTLKAYRDSFSLKNNDKFRP